MLQVYAREIDEEEGKLLGEFAPEQVKHLIDVARISELFTGALSCVKGAAYGMTRTI